MAELKPNQEVIFFNKTVIQAGMFDGKDNGTNLIVDSHDRIKRRKEAFTFTSAYEAVSVVLTQLANHGLSSQVENDYFNKFLSEYPQEENDGEKDSIFKTAAKFFNLLDGIKISIEEPVKNEKEDIDQETKDEIGVVTMLLNKLAEKGIKVKA